jgi:hypothetical protein
MQHLKARFWVMRTRFGPNIIHPPFLGKREVKVFKEGGGYFVDGVMHNV